MSIRRIIPETIGQVPGREPHWIDLHFRKKCTLGWYHGGTCLLEGKLVCRGEATKRFSFSANPAYQVLSPNLMRETGWGLLGQGEMIEEIKTHLLRAAERAPDEFYRNQGEGYYQNKLCHAMNRQWQTSNPWLILDRECVLDFATVGAAARDELYNNIANRLQMKSRPRELDMLTLAADGRLHCIELKHATNAKWADGGKQVLFYHEAFSQVLQFISADVKKLVQQKVGCGLMPRIALSWLPEGDKPFAMGCPALAVAGEPSQQKWNWDPLRNALRGLGRPDLYLEAIRLRFDPITLEAEMIQCV